jgi:methionyl-tRNA synthetase
MQQRYFAGAVQPLGTWTDEDRDLADAFRNAADQVALHTEQLAFHRALEALWRAIDHANKYIVTTSPFTLAKDSTTIARAGAVLHHLLEGLFVTAVLLRPFLPESSAKILAMLNVPADAELTAEWTWGTALADGHVTQQPQVLFPRIET